MKKLFTFVTIAVMAVACCNNQTATVTVEKFFENPKAFVGKDTTLAGAIQSGCTAGQFVLSTVNNNEKMQLLIIPAVENVKFCPGCVGKEVNLKGTISEIIVDTEFIVNLENEANADANVETKEGKLKKVAEFREILSTSGVFSIYKIAATNVAAKDGKAENCTAGEKTCCQDEHKAVAEGGQAGCCEGKETAQCEKACEKKVE